jgi:hypothetical protein
VLDDYTPLRQISEEAMEQEAVLFPVRKTPWYFERRPLGQGGQASQGAAYFIAENPPFGAVFTYHLADRVKSLEEQRREQEKKLEKEWKDTPYVGYDALERERRQPKATILLTVRDIDGNVVRTLDGPAKAGFQRVAWDLTYPTTDAIREASGDEWRRRGGDPDSGFMAPPGTYSVELSKRVDGKVTQLAGPLDFEVVRVFAGVLDGSSPTDVAAFMRQIADLQRSVTAADAALTLAFQRIEDMEKALVRSTIDPGTLDTELEAFKQKLYDLDQKLSGNRTIGAIGHPRVPTVSRRLRVASMGGGMSDYGPTATHRRSFEIAREEFGEIEAGLRQVIDVDLPALEAKMEAAGVPWTAGRPLPKVR